MKASVLSKLVQCGIAPNHPQFMAKAIEMEETEARESCLRRKSGLLRGYAQRLQLQSPMEISRWLHGEGKAIRLGLLREIELWERGTEVLLAVHKKYWEVYRVRFDGVYRLQGRIL